MCGFHLKHFILRLSFINFDVICKLFCKLPLVASDACFVPDYCTEVPPSPRRWNWNPAPPFRGWHSGVRSRSLAAGTCTHALSPSSPASDHWAPRELHWKRGGRSLINLMEDTQILILRRLDGQQVNHYIFLEKLKTIGTVDS